MDEKLLSEISKKLNVLISLSLRQLLDDKDFDKKKRRPHGAGHLARHFSDMGLDPTDIADVLNAPVGSIRTLLTPKRRQ